MKINWDIANPEEVKIEDLGMAQEKDFPDTYCGRAWKAAWKMYHEGYKKDPKNFLKQDGWGEFPYLMNCGMDLTGFMVGWACNTLRFILGESPVADGATVIFGESKENQPIGVPPGNPAESVEKAIGGDRKP